MVREVGDSGGGRGGTTTKRELSMWGASPISEIAGQRDLRRRRTGLGILGVAATDVSYLKPIQPAVDIPLRWLRPPCLKREIDINIGDVHFADPPFFRKVRVCGFHTGIEERRRWKPIVLPAFKQCEASFSAVLGRWGPVAFQGGIKSCTATLTYGCDRIELSPVLGRLALRSEFGHHDGPLSLLMNNSVVVFDVRPDIICSDGRARDKSEHKC